MIKFARSANRMVVPPKKPDRQTRTGSPASRVPAGNLDNDKGGRVSVRFVSPFCWVAWGCLSDSGFPGTLAFPAAWLCLLGGFMRSYEP